MNIGLWSDSHNFPSLPLMKLSAFYKQNPQNKVEHFFPLYHYDVVFASKTFSFTPDIDDQCIINADKLIKGGSGYNITVKNGKEVYNADSDTPLESEIEHICPDYSLYPEYKYATGFLTRGCPRNCAFCIVSKKEGKCSKQVADLWEFWRWQKEIKLLDPNLLACKDRDRLLLQLFDSGAKIDFTQGLDARFITDDIAKLINKIRTKMVHFAFDCISDERKIIKGLEIFKKHYSGDKRNVRVYVLTNFDTTHYEDLYRVKKVSELGFQPYVMIYQKGTQGRFLTDLQRWSNNSFIYRKTSFLDYIPRSDGKTVKELYGKIIAE